MTAQNSALHLQILNSPAIVEDLPSLGSVTRCCGTGRHLTLEARPTPLHWYILPATPEHAIPQLSWPRCCKKCMASYIMAAAMHEVLASLPRTRPMTPHMLPISFL